MAMIVMEVETPAHIRLALPWDIEGCLNRRNENEDRKSCLPWPAIMAVTNPFWRIRRTRMDEFYGWRSINLKPTEASKIHGGTTNKISTTLMSRMVLKRLWIF